MSQVGDYVGMAEAARIYPLRSVTYIKKAVIGIGSGAIYNRSNHLKDIRCIQQAVDKLVHRLLVYPLADAYQEDVRRVHPDVRVSGGIFNKAIWFEHLPD